LLHDNFLILEVES